MTLADLQASNDRVVKGHAIALKAMKGSKPPEEFKIFGFGPVKTSKGEYLFDEEAAELVMAAYKEQGNELCFDYEHSMAPDSPPGPKPAAGWYGLEMREDGLYAVNVRFSKRAESMLSEGEYRYFSPLMEFTKEEPHRILALWNLALTNMPATKNMQPLVAASKGFDHRTKGFVAKLGLLTFDQMRDMLSRAVRQVITEGYAYVCDVYDTNVIVDTNGKLYRMPYTIEGGAAMLGEPVQQVFRTYETFEERMASEETKATKAKKGDEPDEDPDHDGDEHEEEEQKALVACKAAKEPAACKSVPFKTGKVIEGKWDADAAQERLRKWASSDGSGAKDKMNWAKYAKGFAYVTDGAEHFGDFHLPHHDVAGGKLVVSKKGVEAAAGAVQGARGASIPEDEVGAVKKHLAQHYHQWGGTAPWETETEKHTMKTVLAQLSLAPTTDEATTLVALNTQYVNPAREIIALTGATDLADAKTKIAALKKAAEDKTAECVALSAKVHEAEVAKLGIQVEKLVDDAVVAGQLTPAEKPFWLEQGKKDVAALNAYLAIKPKTGAVTEPLKQPAARPTTSVALSQAEIEAAQRVGLDPVKMQEWKNEQAAKGKNGGVRIDMRPASGLVSEAK